MGQLDLSNLNKAWDRWLSTWGKQHRLPGLVGIHFSHNGFALAYVVPNAKGKPKLQVCDFISCMEEHFAERLAEAVNLHQLKGVDCCLVSNRPDYHLLLIDKPHVPEEEIQDALQWLVKDLIDFPIHDAIVDFFDIPEAIMHDPRKIFVVVAQKNVLQKKADLINASGLCLTSIDITAFVLRNLGVLLADSRQDIALLYIEQNGCAMVVLSKLFLCLIRQINVTLGAFDEAGANTKMLEENLVEEVQRTLDYCKQQITHISPTQLFVLPVDEEHVKVTQYLCKELPEIAQEVDFNAVFDISSHIDQKVLAHCSLALCGALRQEETM